MKLEKGFKDRVVKDLYSSGLVIAKTMAIKNVLERLSEIPVELLYDIENERIIDREVRGIIDLPRTIQLLGSGRFLVASLIHRRTYDTPEMILIANIVYEINNLLDELEKLINQDNVIVEKALSIVIDDLRGASNKISWLIDFIGAYDRLDYDSLLSLCDDVIERGIYGYFQLAKSFKNYIMTIKALEKHVYEYVKTGRTGPTISIETEKLFELYTFYLVVYSMLKKLEVKGPVDLIINHKNDYIGLILRSNSEAVEYRIYHDKSFDKKSWLTEYGTINSDILRASRPDITITVWHDGHEEIVFVCDAKHRRKDLDVRRELRIVLGYMNEYSVNKGSIIFDATYAGEKLVTPAIARVEHRYAAIIPLLLNVVPREINVLDNIIEKHSELITRYIIDMIID